MELLDHLATVVKKPIVLKKHQPLFLLSHMRANTSLLGHILGSNPEIVGYYEMHIGYYSWKSLLRQRLKYYQQDSVKPGARYIFDKILHDFHYVDMELLNSVQAKFMFSLREPEQTIKSIVHQFKKERPGHEFCDVLNAGDYYCSRVKTLGQMVDLPDEFIYFDAAVLKTNTEQLLAKLSGWLKLDQPLTPEFDNFAMTGKRDSGDHSGKLAIGTIEKSETDYSAIEIPEELNVKAQFVYREIREKMTHHPRNILKGISNNFPTRAE